MSDYDAFAPVYDAWSGHMTEDVAFYVSLAAEAEGPVVELAVGNGRIAVPIAERTGRRVIGLDLSEAMLAGAAERAARAGVELDLRQGDMRDLRLDEPTDLVICPFRSLLHLPTRADRLRVFERVAAALVPGGRFAWNAFVFDQAVADEIGGAWREQGGVEHRVDYDFDERRIDLSSRAARPCRSGGSARRVGRARRRRRARGRGPLRELRPRAARRDEPRGDLRRAPPVSDALYDRIARIYDPWSVSVTEDVEFYVDEALASGGPVVELAVGTGRIAVPTAHAGIPVIGVDESPGMIAVARERAEQRGRRGAARPPRRRPARAAGRRARAPRHDPVPVAAPHARRGGEAPGAPGCRSDARARRPPRLRRLRAVLGGHRGDGRAVARARARDLRARRLGRARADARPLRAERRPGRDDGAPLALARGVERAARGGGLRGRGALRLVRPPAVGGRRGPDLGLPPRATASRELDDLVADADATPARAPPRRPRGRTRPRRVRASR